MRPGFISQVAASFDHPVGSREDGVWNSQTNRSGGFEVHRKFKRNRLFYGEIGRRSPFEDPVHEISAPSRNLHMVLAIAREPSVFHEIT